jgi:muramoyltetrapeptide carboxypeptidase LdcA involved in peptidoglycan recycling
LNQNPQARADDLMGAFADPSIKAIFSTIGGDDSIRLLPLLDLSVITSNPKIFLGMSDTTVTHLACFKAGLTSFYGPGIMQAFAENCGMLPYVIDSVRRSLFSSDPIGEVKPDASGWTVEFLNWADPENQSRKRKLNPAQEWKYLQGKGVHRGRLLGGCIEVLDWLRGTPVWPGSEAWKGAILFIETSEEAPPALEVLRMLRSFTAMGITQGLAGLIFGRPGGETPIDKFSEYDKAIQQAAAEAGRGDLPIVTRMDFGHTDPVFILPYGVAAEIDCERRRFSIVESAQVG